MEKGDWIEKTERERERQRESAGVREKRNKNEARKSQALNS